MQSLLLVVLVDAALGRLADALAHVADGHVLHVAAAQEGAQVAAAHVADADAAHDDPLAGRRAVVGAQGGGGDDVGHGDRRAGRLQEVAARAVLCDAHRSTSWWKVGGMAFHESPKVDERSATGGAGSWRGRRTLDLHCPPFSQLQRRVSIVAKPQAAFHPGREAAVAKPQAAVYCAPMAREPILQPPPEFKDDDRDLRPQRMQDMVGQREVYARLEIAVDAASKRGEPLGHILFDGPPGLGKTTFAMCIPRDLGVGFQIASGAALAAPKDVIPYLTNAEERSVLFIDEIHRLPKAVEEFLYPAMEDFRIDLTLGEGVNARTINMSLKPFTLIGATTRTGLLSAPLRDRFQMREHLDFYTVEELAEIVRRNAKKLRVEIVDEAAAGDRRPQPRHAATGQQPAPLGPRLRPEQGRRQDHASPWPATPWQCRASTRWASTRRIGSIWKRSPGCSSAGRWASRRSPTR